MLDFLVIGAQKAGTTTLFRSLRRHPSIYMPIDKELPFFTQKRNADEIRSFDAAYFGAASPGQIRGKATPDYMGRTDTPGVIAGALPDVRLVALLRDPVERAVSHYRMAVKRGQERRPIAAAFAAELRDRRGLGTVRELPPFGTYVTRSEYGRIVGDYLDAFPPDQLLVLPFSSLSTDPHGLLARVHNFLGVPYIAEPTITRRYHAGGSTRRYPHAEERLARFPLARRLWSLLPERRQRLVRYWVDQWNTRPEPLPQSTESLGPVAEAMREHFAADRELLLRRHGVTLPQG